MNKNEVYKPLFRLIVLVAVLLLSVGINIYSLLLIVIGTVCLSYFILFDTYYLTKYIVHNRALKREN